ncbi:unnamed protein product [Prorocentrum cordatum]|uniref:Uncharacterized protein n=1 Tax=Prorocentrum cordatum TaxID=2364126 RepID=A0ABN9VXE3_9DINO|nr:unnamed protein product [Polarella glacialis]
MLRTLMVFHVAARRHASSLRGGIASTTAAFFGSRRALLRFPPGAGARSGPMQQLGGVLGLFCGPQPTAQLDTPQKDRQVLADSTDSPVDRAAEREAHVVVPMTPEFLREGMNAAAAGIQPWDDRRFRRVKQLQEAKRNHGCVELMREGGVAPSSP